MAARRQGNGSDRAERLVEPVTGIPTTPTTLALLAVPVIIGVFAAVETLEWIVAPQAAAAVPPGVRALHLARGIGLSWVFAGLAAWAVGRNWRRALSRIRAAEARAREAERARLERDRLVALGRIAAGVAHEIGNPLASISAICQLIERKGDDGRLADRARLVRAEVDRIAGIVGDLLAFARPTTRDPAPVDLAPIFARVAEMFRADARTEGIALDVDVAPATAVRGIGTEVEQIVLNLVWNAVEAIRTGGGRGGRVRLAARPGRAGEIEIEVADDGPGVPEAIRRRIFEPFFTTKEMGTGLGLSVVHGLVEDIGGRVDVGRSPLGGALFRVVLPAAGGERSAGAASKEGRPEAAAAR